MAGNRSKISDLPREIQDEVERLIRENTTIDRIVEHLRTLGADISRSSVGRFKQNAEARMHRYREQQQIASVWVQQIGEDPQGDIGQLAAELLKMVASQTAMEMGENDQPVDPKDINFLASAIKNLETAGKISLDRELIIRRELAKEHAKKLDTALKDATAAGEKGLSAERVAQLRRDFLGVRDGA